jgi:hypothetical protein
MACVLEQRVLEALERVAVDPRRPASPPHLRDHIVDKLRPLLEEHGPAVGFTLRVSPRGTPLRRGRVVVKMNSRHITVPVG